MKFGQTFQQLLAVGVCVMPCLVSAQLSGSVGPTTSTASKAAKKICNVLDYGAKADGATDIGPPLQSAFAACQSGGIVYVPSGTYSMATFQTLTGGSGWALQLDGIIERASNSATGGHMIIVTGATDFEFFSRTSKGAIQGYGYQFLEKNTYGPRLIRLVQVNHWSFHDIALVDSPAFHLILDNCENGEVYNTIIRGANRGGLDGIDVSGSNIWIHDVEVTNKDECVTIKNPSNNMRVENIYCNWSGGSAMGSLGAGITISKIQYNNIYTWQSNQMFMIKSNGGSGTVSDCSFTNFIGHSNAYSLDIDSLWSSMTPVAGNGVQLTGLTFENWQGSVIDPKRAPVNVVCPAAVPCTGINISNVAFWSDDNAAVHYSCTSGYGSGACLKSGSGGSYPTVTDTISSAPANWDGPKMPNDLPAGLGISASIAIPAVPTTYYPGVAPISKLLNGSGAGAGSAGATTTAGSAKTTSTTTAAGSTGSCAAVYGQCGGTPWTGPTCCASGSTCTYSNAYYSQCLPG